MHNDPTLEAPAGFQRIDPAALAADLWREIDRSLLDDARCAAPPFPVQLLPPAWERWAIATAQAAGTPVDYVAQGLFAAVAALCGAGVLARVMPTWSEPLVLWQALVGLPSSGKTPALAAVRRPLAQIEDRLRARDPERRAQHATSVERARLMAEQWQERCAEAVAAGEPTPAKPAEAEFTETFTPTQLVVADSTMEALADVVAGNPRGVILWRDELAAWIANLNRYANGGSDRAQWLEAWSASGVTINRRSRANPLHLEKFPISVVGTIQPDRIAEAFSGGDDGMAARFLFSWPDAPHYTPLMERGIADNDAALAMLARIADTAGSPGNPRLLVFDELALHAFDHFMRAQHAETQAMEGLEAGWLGKGPGTVARLAAILMLLSWSEYESPVPPATIDRERIGHAIGLWTRYFKPHARAVFNQAGRTDRDRQARRAVRWLRASGFEEVSREQIRCEALSYSVDAEGADKVIARLEQGGILRRVTVEGRRPGRPSRRWAVNPALME